MDDRTAPTHHASLADDNADDPGGRGMSPSDQASDIEGAQPVVTTLVLRRDFLKYTLVSSAGFVAATSLLGEGGALSALAQTASAAGRRAPPPRQFPCAYASMAHHTACA